MVEEQGRGLGREDFSYDATQICRVGIAHG